MKKIQDFYVDRNNSILESNRNLMNYIESFSNEKNLSELLHWISTKINVSQKSIRADVKKFIFEQFVNLRGKFNNSFSKSKIIFHSLKFLVMMIYIRFFSTREKNIIKSEVLVDDITKHTNPKRFERLNDLCDTTFVSNVKLNNKYKNFFFDKYKKCLIGDKIANSYIFFFTLFFKVLFYSIKIGCNLYPLILRIMLLYLKYETVFSNTKSKFLIQERHYNTSAIKNEIFHKHGGKISTSIQKNILQINGVGMYMNLDILFTLGKNTGSMVKKLGGDVKKLIPVGSLLMERELFIRPDKNEFFTYDILVFASNHNSNFHSGYNSYYEDYYLHFSWIKKISEEYPNFKIGIKLKAVLKDNKVKEIFLKSKNVDILVDKSSGWSDTYYLAQKARSLCTWSSTLGYEFIGINKECYFLDPGARNIGFLPNEDNLKKAKVTDYSNFRDKMIKCINGEVNYEILQDKEKFCMNSKNVSENILKYLRVNEGKF